MVRKWLISHLRQRLPAWQTMPVDPSVQGLSFANRQYELGAQRWLL